MNRLIRIGFAICILCFALLSYGCGANFANSDVKWSDVNQKFVELERERLETIEELKGKPLVPIAKSSKAL